MEKKKFIMMDGKDLYVKSIGMYCSNFHDAKIFEDDPREFEKYGNKIIILDTMEGLELMAEQIETLDRMIPEAERRLKEMVTGRNNFYDASPKLREYIQEHNKRLHPVLGITEYEKKRIIEEICKK